MTDAVLQAMRDGLAAMEASDPANPGQLEAVRLTRRWIEAATRLQALAVERDALVAELLALGDKMQRLGFGAAMEPPARQ